MFAISSPDEVTRCLCNFNVFMSRPYVWMTADCTKTLVALTLGLYKFIHHEDTRHKRETPNKKWQTDRQTANQGRTGVKKGNIEYSVSRALPLHPSPPLHLLSFPSLYDQCPPIPLPSSKRPNIQLGVVFLAYFEPSKRIWWVTTILVPFYWSLSITSVL